MVEEGPVKEAVDIIRIGCCLQEASDEHGHGLVLDIVQVQTPHEGWSEEYHLFWFLKLVRVQPAFDFTVYTCDVCHS